MRIDVARSEIVELRIIDERIRTWGLPRYQSEMAAGVDLFACIDGPLVLHAQAPAILVSSGIAIHIAKSDIVGLVVPRSGFGHKHGIVTGNLVGVIDADYTGPLMISLWNRNAPQTQPVTIEPGDRVAQLLFMPLVRPVFDVVDDFSASSRRAEAGFGSTG